MTGWTTVTFESRFTTSPIWVRLVDTYTVLPPVGPLDVVLERRVGAGWVELGVPHQLSPHGDLAFLGLGRRRAGGRTDPFDVRITVSAPRTVAETQTGQSSVEATVMPWTPESPPPASAPERISFFPGPAYRFGPGVPVLSGWVRDVAGDPVKRAQVTSETTVRGTVLAEEVRTDDDGGFRLPLRWSAGTTQVDARRGTTSGSITIDVPDDLGSVHVITLT